MAVFRVLSKFDPQTGKETRQHNAVWRGEAENFYEAKQKAAAACKWRIEPGDMQAYDLSSSSEIKWG